MYNYVSTPTYMQNRVGGGSYQYNVLELIILKVNNNMKYEIYTDNSSVKQTE